MRIRDYGFALKVDHYQNHYPTRRYYFFPMPRTLEAYNKLIKPYGDGLITLFYHGFKIGDSIMIGPQAYSELQLVWQTKYENH